MRGRPQRRPVQPSNEDQRAVRIGIFGGTFDPPHIGHLIVAQEVHFRLHLDTLLVVPAGDPPHKPDRYMTPGRIRLEMVEAALGSDPRFQPSDVEIRREGPSYTVDTVRSLAQADPQADFFLVVGADQLRELGTWKNVPEIRRLAKLVGFRRPGSRSGKLPDGVIWIDGPRVDVSSTWIRGRVARGEPIQFLVPNSVEAVIRRRRLYLADGVLEHGV